MAKIDELLKELCPDGVEWKTIKELFETRNGYTPSTKNSSFWTNGDIPWFKMEDIRDKGHILSDAYSHITKSALKGKGLFKANSIILATSATIGEHALITVDHLSNQRFTNIYPKEKWVNKIHMKFVYYYMYLIDEWCKTHVKQGSFAAVDMDGFYKQEIPIPPLSIQQEIVEVLDTFTDAISNLEEELSLREKQFEFYREQLLSFENEVTSVFKVGDLFDFKNGLNKEKSSFGKGTTIVNYTDVYKNRGLNKSMLTGLVTLSDSEIERFQCFKGDVFFTRTSETKEEIGYPAVLLEDINHCTFSGFLLRARPKTSKLLPEYCKYCFFTHSFRKEVIKFATLTTRALTNGGSLSKINIYVPPIERQQEIVEILDTFEALIANIKEEIALRTRQYEYYREKLLSFGK